MSLLLVCFSFIACDPPDQPDVTEPVVVRVPAPRPDTGSTDFALLAAPLTDGELRVHLEDTAQQFARTVTTAGAER